MTIHPRHLDDKKRDALLSIALPRGNPHPHPSPPDLGAAAPRRAAASLFWLVSDRWTMCASMLQDLVG
jgi:hypothetical protein